MLARGLIKSAALPRTYFYTARSPFHLSAHIAKDEKLYKLHHKIHVNEVKFKAKGIVRNALKGKRVKVMLLSPQGVPQNELDSKLESCIEVIKNAAEEHEVELTIDRKLPLHELNITGVPLINDEPVT